MFVPGDDGYDTARQTWNVTTFDQHPAIIVMPSISADLASAVSFAREHNLSIAVQNGGYGHPYPATDALLVNFASMTTVQITPVAATSDSSERSGAAGRGDLYILRHDATSEHMKSISSRCGSRESHGSPGANRL